MIRGMSQPAAGEDAVAVVEDGGLARGGDGRLGEVGGGAVAVDADGGGDRGAAVADLDGGGEAGLGGREPAQVADGEVCALGGGLGANADLGAGRVEVGDVELVLG